MSIYFGPHLKRSFFPDQTLPTWSTICTDVSENGKIKAENGRYIEKHQLGEMVLFLPGRESRAELIYRRAESSLHILVSCLWRTGSPKTSALWFARYRPKQQANMETHQWGFWVQLDSDRRGRWPPFIFFFSFISLQPVTVCFCQTDCAQECVFY